MSKELYAINIAIKRPDGAIEQDTMYSKEPLTENTAKEVAERLSVDVIMVQVGKLKIYDEPLSFVYELPPAQEIISEVQDE